MFISDFFCTETQKKRIEKIRRSETKVWASQSSLKDPAALLPINIAITNILNLSKVSVERSTFLEL